MAIFTAPTAVDADKRGVHFGSTEIVGEVRSIRDYEGWAIVELSDKRKVVGEFDPVEITAGVAYRFFGRWDSHATYGLQFRCDSHVVADAADQGRNGIVAYLHRSNVGLNKRDAEKLYDAFGADTLNVICESPDRAAEVIGEEKAEEAAKKLSRMSFWKETRVALYQLFAGRGIPKGAIQGCIDKWGLQAPKVVRRDPFSMLVADIPGIGFKRADDLFLDLGGNRDRLKRLMMAAWNALRTSDSGSTWEIRGVMYKAMAKAAGRVDARLFARALELAIRARWVERRDVEGGESYYAEHAHARAERLVSEHLRRLMRGKSVWPSVGYSGLSEHQRAKVEAIIGSPVGILAGSPGVGKTFTASVMLTALLRMVRPDEVAVCAPTGKAAVRITDVMKSKKLPFQATTIHALLQIDGDDDAGSFRFRANAGNPLPHRVIVVDEVSMCDTSLLAALLSAVGPGGNVLFVGDPYQLPPVGHGAPLRDMIGAGVPTALLEEIQRNSGAIVRGCREIKSGRLPEMFTRVDIENGMNLIHIAIDDSINEDGERRMNVSDQHRAIQAIIDRVRERAEYDPVWDVQVLVARNSKTALSREFLNPRLQSYLNGGAIEGAQKYRINDKVICLRNQDAKMVDPFDAEAAAWAPEAVTDADRYEFNGNACRIANGDMGRVVAVAPKHMVVNFLAPDRLVKVQIERGRKGESKLSDFDLAYAVTVHKYQGSEVPIVILPLDEMSGLVASRNWVYTAISRAKVVCFVIGKTTVLDKMIRRDITKERKTFLSELVSEWVGKP